MEFFIRRFSQVPTLQEARADDLLFELIAIKFELADKAHELEKLKRQVADERGGGTEEKGGSDEATASDKDSDSDLHSRDMLYLAAEEGLDEIVKGILNPKARHKDALGEVFGHAIRRAARNGHISIVKRLMAVDGYLAVRSTEEDGLHQSCLHAAAIGGHEPVVRLLLAYSKEKLVRSNVHVLCV